MPENGNISNMKISELMTREALVVTKDIPVDRMIQLFAKHEITGAPVIDAQGEMVGVVSLTDVYRKSEVSTVADIMTHLLICAEESDDIEVAADLMVNHGIHRVVVTRDGKVTGVITAGDLIKEFRNRLKAAPR